jgi:hypothetical protein
VYLPDVECDSVVGKDWGTLLFNIVAVCLPVVPRGIMYRPNLQLQFKVGMGKVLPADVVSRICSFDHKIQGRLQKLSRQPLGPTAVMLTGHWKATGHFVGNPYKPFMSHTKPYVGL